MSNNNKIKASSRRRANKGAAVPPSADEQILNATIRDRMAIRVGLSRLVLLLVPSSLFVTFQTTNLVHSMFDLRLGESFLWLTYLLCGVVTVLNLLYVGINTINAKGEEIYNEREGEFLGLSELGKSKVLNEEEDDTKAVEKSIKKAAIVKDINYEASLFGVWVVNGTYLLSFIFMSFVVFRFSSTTWNFIASTIGAAVLSQYVPSLFVKTPSYYFNIDD